MSEEYQPAETETLLRGEFEFSVLRYGQRKPARCGLRIYLHPQYAVVVASELENNPGMSITNAAELLAEQVCKRFFLRPSSLVWVENYPSRVVRGASGKILHRTEETWDLVTFTVSHEAFSLPKWRHISRQEAEALCGQSL